MRNHIYYLGLLILYLISCQSKTLTSTKAEVFPENAKSDMDIFLMTAVKSGIGEDNLPKDLLKEILNSNNLWVGKCPICMAVQRGFRAYIQEGEARKSNILLKSGLLTDLRSSGSEEQKIALKTLIDGYVKDHYIRLKMTNSERATMKTKLEAGRKKGMERMGSNGKFCASCDGACAKP